MERAAAQSLVDQARSGDRGAWDKLLGELEGKVYGLALRMLGDPTAAEDASQEILLKVVSGLPSYRGEASLSTWVYQVAANHLLTERAKGAERMQLSFEALGVGIDAGLQAAATPPLTLDESLLAEEAKLICTHAMLVCLDREHRLAYILGEILEVTGEEAAAILEVEPAAFRKRLSRARERIESFMQGRCGLVNPAVACRCHRQVGAQVGRGLLDPQHPRFARHPVRHQKERLQAVLSSAEVFRSHPDYRAPEGFLAKVRDLAEEALHGSG